MSSYFTLLNSAFRGILPESYAARFVGFNHPRPEGISQFAHGTPLLGTGIALSEIITGTDPITMRPTSRLGAVANVVMSVLPFLKVKSQLAAETVGRTRVALDNTMRPIGEWRPGSADIFINRAAVREEAKKSGRTVGRELYITAYHEAFHRAVYSIDRLASRLYGVDDIYGASRAAMEAGVGKGRWYRFEELGAETWGKVRATLRDSWGIK